MYVHVRRSPVCDIIALPDGQKVRNGSGAGLLCNLLFSPIYLCWKVRDVELCTLHYIHTHISIHT